MVSCENGSRHQELARRKYGQGSRRGTIAQWQQRHLFLSGQLPSDRSNAKEGAGLEMAEAIAKNGR
ncbi:MAG: hypothetical protein QNK82_10695 [Akkermansiaceae bacterium]